MKNGYNKGSKKVNKKQKEKLMAITLATGLTIGALPGNITFAEVNAIEKLKSVLEINEDKKDIKISKQNNNKSLIQPVTLSNGTIIEVVEDAVTGDISLKVTDKNGTSTTINILNCFEVKEIKETTNGGYIVTHRKDDEFVYRQEFASDHSKIGDEKIVGMEIENFEEGITISLDMEVDKENHRTTIITSKETVTIENFTPLWGDYMGVDHLYMLGEDSNGYTSWVVVTSNGKVINGDIIKDLNYISSDYNEVKVNALSDLSDLEDGKFILGGYAIKASEPNKKDGFLVQFDELGNRDSEVKIIPSSYGENDDATINSIIKFASGNIRLNGPNLKNYIYLNSLNYIDARPVKESLTLSNGKSYKVVKEVNKSRSGDDTSTFTVKSVNELVEYDIATYRGVKDIKLVPGNDNQVIIAVSNADDSTEIGIINTEDDGGIDNNGEAFSKVINTGKIEGDNGAILNIDIENIKIDTDGKLSFTADGNKVENVVVDDVNPGTPVVVIPPVEEPSEPETPDDKPEEIPPVDGDNNGTTPQPPVDGGDNGETPKPPVDGDNGETPKPPVDGGDNGTTPQPPVEEKPEEPSKPETPEEKPEVAPPTSNNQIVNVDKGEQIVFDANKPTNITIKSSKLENKVIDYILVNGIKVTRTAIEGKNTRMAKEYFTVNEGAITLSQQLFEDLNLETKDGYIVGVGFADGSEISDLVKLSVVDTTVNPPIQEDGNGQEGENDSNTGNVDNNVQNSTTNKEENKVESSNTENNKLPNTGAPISSGVLSAIGVMFAFIGSRLLKRK